MFNVKNRWFLGFLAIFFTILLTGASCSNQTIDTKEENVLDDYIEETVLEPAEEEIVGGDRDEYGCIGSAGYTWCEVKEKCLRTWEEECEAKEHPSIAEEVDWRNYTNEKLGYGVSYPGICTVSTDLGQSVDFTGPLENNEWWPRITIAHRDTDFYNPPAGTDVVEWVQKFPELKEGKEVSIDGLTTLHFVQERSPQAYGADYYYFIKEGQLYQITLLHTADRQDWPLYDKFLESFTFVD